MRYKFSSCEFAVYDYLLCNCNNCGEEIKITNMDELRDTKFIGEKIYCDNCYRKLLNKKNPKLSKKEK